MADIASLDDYKVGERFKEAVRQVPDAFAARANLIVSIADVTCEAYIRDAERAREDNRLTLKMVKEAGNLSEEKMTLFEGKMFRKYREIDRTYDEKIEAVWSKAEEEINSLLEEGKNLLPPTSDLGEGAPPKPK